MPLPLPPAGLTADSDLLPRLLWRRAPPSADVVRAAAGAAAARAEQAAQRPLHEALLEQVDGDGTPSGDGGPWSHSFASDTAPSDGGGAVDFHPSLVLSGTCL